LTTNTASYTSGGSLTVSVTATPALKTSEYRGPLGSSPVNVVKD